jgi:hypothetical protein
MIPCGELPGAGVGRTLPDVTDTTNDTDTDSMGIHDPDELARRYVALWNEPDPAVRAAAIRQVWTPDGGQVTSPPQEIVLAAQAVGFPPPPLAVRGYHELDARVTHAYEEFIGSGKYVFRAVAGQSHRLGDVVTMRWEMLTADGGEVAGAGLDFFTLADDGRIRMDHQFVF